MSMTRPQLLNRLGTLHSTIADCNTEIDSIIIELSKNPLEESVAAAPVNQAGDSSSLVGASKPKFGLSAASLRELNGVDARLVQCVKLAITLTPVDFTVYDGIRTVKEQQSYVAKGTSKTMQSKHLDGLAVDLVPWINGKPVWDWTGCYKIAWAMDQAATQLGFAGLITWGGAWDRTLADFGGDLGSYEQEVGLYRKRHAGSDFIDGPHFEIRGPKQ